MSNMRLVTLILVTLFLSFQVQGKTYELKGRVTDFNGHAIDSATVKLMNEKFEILYQTLSDKNGYYSMTVKEGTYYCLYAIKLSEYKVNRLEYWNWNVPIYQNMTINPQYDKMEIYGISVFEPKVTPQETYMIYFRPMSLNKFLQLASDRKIEKKSIKDVRRTEELLGKNNKWIDIAPDSISKNELEVTINGIKMEIVGINKITEYARGIQMYGFCVQVLKPRQNQELKSEYDLISITLHSVETGEIGKGEVFVKRNSF